MVHQALPLFRLSFSEDLQNPGTPSALTFPINTFESHSQLGLCCLEGVRRRVAPPESTFTSQLQRYAMRYWPVHVAHGTPTVTTAPDAEWKATAYSAMLQTLSFPQWQRWVNTYAQLVHPGAFQGVNIDDSESNWLKMQSEQGMCPLLVSSAYSPSTFGVSL
jgi:hypothetical protein